MDWNAIIPITLFITYVLLAWFCFRLGCKSVKPIEINNNELLNKQKTLEDNISILQKTQHQYEERNTDLNNSYDKIVDAIFAAEEKRKLIEQSNKQAQEFIAQSEQLAKEKAETVYEKRYDELKQEYKARYIDLHSILEHNENLIKEQKNELESLQKTRLAAIAAAQKEKEIQENKDDYCLILPREESNDVEILRGVIKKIAKPRSILMAIWQAYYQPIAKKKFPKILGKTDVCGIYKITNQETGECYIGQAVDVRRRWMDHCKAGLGIDTPQGNQLYAAMQEYGLDSFSFELLLECESNQLNEKEKYFIQLYNSDAFGYNMNKGVN